MNTAKSQKASQLIKEKSQIFFDFDGVLVDSYISKENIYLNAFHSALPEIDLKELKRCLRQTAGRPRLKKISEVLEMLSQRRRFDEISALKLSLKDMVDTHMKSIIPPIDRDAHYVLQALRDSGKYMYILTAAPSADVERILRFYGIDDYFVNIFAPPLEKHVHLTRLFNDNHLMSDESILIGDSFSDYTSAQAVSIDFIGRKHKYNLTFGQSVHPSIDSLLELIEQ